MFKALRLSSIIFPAVMFVFTLSFSALQACEEDPGKSCCGEPCEERACPMKETEAELAKTACNVCEETEKSCNVGDVVLNIRGMTCAGSECRVKDALSAFEGVSDVNVNYKDGNAHMHVEEGKVDNAALIEALRQVGFLASEGK